MSLHAAWMPHYLPMMACVVVLGFILMRTTRRALLFTVQMLVLLLFLVLGSAVAASVDAVDISQALNQLATLVLGMTLIRQGGLTIFRLVVPKLGLHPPRILEELLILLAYVAWILVRLSAGGLDLGSLVASTAVITAVLAFAMQDTLGNILAGLALQLDHSVHIGDWILLEDISGQVEQVQWRHTAIRTLFGELVLIPNSQLMKSRVMLTGGQSAPRRLRSVNFYGSMDLSPSLVIAEVQKALANADLPTVGRRESTECVVLDFTNGMVQYAVRYWLIDPKSPGSTDSLVRQHIHALFRRRGWRMAAPTQDVLLGRANLQPYQEFTQRVQLSSIDVVRSLPLFEPLTDDEVRQLAVGLRVVPYVAGSLITRQHDIGDCLYILLSGKVDVWLEDNGKRHALAVLEPLQIMGETSLLTGDPRSATLTARTDVECYVISQDDFQHTLRNRPELADSFAQLLTDRLQERMALREKMQQPQVIQQKAAILIRIRSLFSL
ncbi:mechanosensitive ion channel [Alcaligenaceae bacterium]|nr:mechanosensitive ion channel [Alcaligenaceae bacterium]